MVENPDIEKALAEEDPLALAKRASGEELERLKISEEIMGLQHQRRQRGSPFAMAAQVVVAIVAIGGFVINMVQNYVNGHNQLVQERMDLTRWEQEFERAKRADKYRAFFETAALATDLTNPGKRLVGYALLQEFVADKDYNGKATLMLQQALAQELSADAQPGLSAAHRSAVEAIVTALAASRDCKDLERAARTIDFLGKRREETKDTEEAREVFEIYVRGLLGRAALVCPTLPELVRVRQPLRDTLVKLPEVGGLSGRLAPGAASLRLAEILRNGCRAEEAVSGVSDCPEIYGRYRKLCDAVPAAARSAEEAGACRVFADPKVAAAFQP
ncbi:MAG: hypothetical protein ACYDCL_04790 [Myxococcales bacterium]